MHRDGVFSCNPESAFQLDSSKRYAFFFMVVVGVERPWEIPLSFVDQISTRETDVDVVRTLCRSNIVFEHFKWSTCIARVLSNYGPFQRSICSSYNSMHSSSVEHFNAGSHPTAHHFRLTSLVLSLLEPPDWALPISRKSHPNISLTASFAFACS